MSVKMIIYLEIKESELKWHGKETVLARVKELLPHYQTIS
jgi:hypothetical protein